ncbi:MAG: hypothetical protein H7Z17_19505 [Fuerstia sp.]|nr:hypothetical protein [Fuerstiella sp.]
MNPNPSAVVKLGGSLLTLPDLAERLREVVRLLHPLKVLIVVGGGAAADEIRRLDGICRLTATQAHWDAIAAMTHNADVLSRVCGCLPVVANRIDAAAAWKQHDAVLLNTTTFLREEQTLHSRSLPESWSVTSDSIAAFVALHWPAGQLVFCKSCDLMSPNIEQLCQEDLLDAWFPNLASPLHRSGMQLQWLNLRAATPQLQPIRP